MTKSDFLINIQGKVTWDVYTKLKIGFDTLSTLSILEFTTQEILSIFKVMYEKNTLCNIYYIYLKTNCVYSYEAVSSGKEVEKLLKQHQKLSEKYLKKFLNTLEDDD